jgi:hypothetical protein
LRSSISVNGFTLNHSLNHCCQGYLKNSRPIEIVYFISQKGAAECFSGPRGMPRIAENLSTDLVETTSLFPVVTRARISSTPRSRYYDKLKYHILNLYSCHLHYQATGERRPVLSCFRDWAQIGTVDQSDESAWRGCCPWSACTG